MYRTGTRPTGFAGARLYLSTLLLSLTLVVGLSACGSNTPGDAVGAGAATGEMQMSLTTDPNPAQAGPIKFIVELKDAQGQAVEGAQVSLSARHTGMSHGGIDGQLVEQGAGKYQATGSFSMAGAWHVDVEASKSGLPTKKQSFDVVVR